ncbi:SurA N-terminal domain-containing protein [Methylophaga sp. OBS1]|jgi:peptidyl-prolyl cis-trans isomerase D|uniref:SurA N-terminal domain-containing protein n=1 Tax=Methylophaga sp. OBS1 TaxID=2991933 RepID=UPI0022532FEE|nr:SurA N-terminal domain-containing protein [Methylophaga sp. OBS1]MCX4190981.1 SurA N-terminal domain-containing protein [Methylophaga sp. OBS1]MCX4192073.1 SurA N-terminal domain-containing protein [Methylophaga sp. OBS1]
MLHYIRDRAQGWIAWFIVGLISIPFALWGVNSYMTGASDVVVAEVNGHEINQTELQQSLQQYRDQMRNVLGEQFDPAMFEGAAVKRNILDGLIEQRLLHEASQKLGQTVNDASVSEMIRSNPAFQRDGQFDPDYYAMMLARVGYSPASFEAQLRNDLLTQELTRNIQRSAIVTPVQLDRVLELEKQQREIAYGVVPLQNYVDKVSIDDEAVRAYYDNNKTAYTAPEQVRVNYVELNIDSIADTITVDEEALQQFYVDNESQFVGPEQRRVSHILIEGDDEQALAEIEKIAERLQQGEDFGTLAKAESQDTGSAAQGGDLGYFGPDVMEPAFEEAAFALENVGDISEPVQTEFGYHLIKLTGVESPEVQDFSDVRTEVEQRYRSQQAEAQFYDKAEQLANLSFENPDSLDVAAEELGLEIQTTPLFTRGGTESGISSEAKVVEAAFSEDVLQNELNSAVIELSDTHLVVIHKNKHIPESVLPFESVKPAIEQQLLFDEASQFAREKGEAIVAELKTGAEAQTLLESWQPAAFYGRDSEAVSQQILQRAFEMQKPESQAQYTGFTADNGNYVVIKLTDVQNGQTADVEAEERQSIQEQLQQMMSNAELQAFIASLRADADIEIRDKSLR